jgi:tellurite resistance protein TerC
LNVPFWVWAVTLAALVVVIMVDLWLVDRGGPREFSMRQATAWVTFYVSAAIVFGLGLLVAVGPDYSGQFVSGYITEYSLSVDNLFIFYVIMTRFAVPRGNQHKVLLVGILLALVMRGIFIGVGAAAVARFDWLFYVFGAFLIWTAWGLLRTRTDADEEFNENVVLRWVRRVLPATNTYEGGRLTTRVDGRRLVTPMLIVMVAIGTTDLLFALDSIPAIFGLTKEPYLIFTANAFALMGLRQLYFLLGGLLERLVYLNKGLAIILGFIGVKLVSEALHSSGVTWAPEVPIWLSLSIIGSTILITTVASLIRARRDPSARRLPAPATDPTGDATSGAKATPTNPTSGAGTSDSGGGGEPVTGASGGDAAGRGAEANGAGESADTAADLVGEDGVR